MSKVPGVIRRRGAGWNVMLRVDGRRHEYGPRKVPLLRYGSREEVEEWGLDRVPQARASGEGRRGQRRDHYVFRAWWGCSASK
ncbi:MAG: hypothetical protein ACREM1_23185 [Longimicrobiales bacterium]